MLQQIPLRLVKADTSTQSRCNIDAELVEEYAEQFKAGAKFPPVEATFDGTNYYVWDGIHRTQGAERAGLESIDANVVDGGLDEAKWLACSANKAHGKRRTNADKERAVRQALAHPKAATMTDLAIAAFCGVNDKTVARYRPVSEFPKLENASDGQSSEAPKRTGKDGKKYPAKKKTATKPSPSSSPAQQAAGGKPNDPLDKLNHPIPEHLRPVFSDMRFGEIDGFFGRMRDTLKALASSPAGFHLQPHLSNQDKYLVNGFEEIRYQLLDDGRPHCVCVNCDGSGKKRLDKCPSCKGCGWLTKYKYNQVKRDAEAEASIRK